MTSLPGISRSLGQIHRRECYYLPPKGLNRVTRGWLPVWRQAVWAVLHLGFVYFPTVLIVCLHSGSSPWAKPNYHLYLLRYRRDLPRGILGRGSRGSARIRLFENSFDDKKDETAMLFVYILGRPTYEHAFQIRPFDTMIVTTFQDIISKGRIWTGVLDRS